MALWVPQWRHFWTHQSGVMFWCEVMWHRIKRWRSLEWMELNKDRILSKETDVCVLCATKSQCWHCIFIIFNLTRCCILIAANLTANMWFEVQDHWLCLLSLIITYCQSFRENNQISSLHLGNKIRDMWKKTHNTAYEAKKLSYLQDLAPLRVTVDVLTGMKHAQCHTVQQDHQHGRSLEPCREQ